ncbi:MAG: porin [Alphaproteobacteria bacterium]|nr:porin [Alphaproteobacteria bacterium]
MRLTRKIFLGLGAAVAAASAAHAADPVKLQVSGEATAVAGVSDGKAKGDADADVKLKGSTVLENGVEIGAVVEGRLDGQQPDRLYAGGRYSSLLIGGPRGIAPLGSDAFLEGAYAYSRGSFGEIIVGRAPGIARQLAVTSPTIFRSINVNDWRTDLSGLNDVHTVNDFSGYSTKITYMPPANFLGGVVGGLQLGVSYSPALADCGDRLCAPDKGFVLAPDGTLLTDTAHWQDVLEGALYYQKGVRIGGDRLLVGLGASVVTAQKDSSQALSPIFGDYKAYSVGLNLGFRGITIGGSLKTTNAGLANLDKEGYLAFDAGVTFRTGEEKGDWGFMLGYGQSEADPVGINPADPILFRNTQTAQAGVTYFIGRGITIGAAAQFVESKKPAAAGGQEEAATAVIESSIKF